MQSVFSDFGSNPFIKSAFFCLYNSIAKSFFLLANYHLFRTITIFEIIVKLTAVSSES